MSSSPEVRFISCRATYEHGIDDASSFAAAFAQIAPMLGLMPGRLLVENKHRAFTVPTFVQHVTREASELVAVYTGQADGGEAYVYLRDRVDPKLPGLSEYCDRRMALVAVGADAAAVRELLGLFHRHFGLISANVAGHVDRSYAAKEAIREGVEGAWDEETVSRVSWDAMKYRRARTKLIRLSPITVIGPTLWATLPPMPTFDPSPVVEDLPGAPGCKVITAWPTLCSPRDPDFLRGTRALRAWLWPYTIQNPADDPANDPA